MSHKSGILRCARIALLLSGGLAGSAYAQAPVEQESEARAGGSLDYIVVTAQKRAESLQDVPLAISAYSGDTLQNLGVTGTQALQFVTPGLVFTRTGPQAQPYIRGVGTRLSGGGLEPSIAVYVDDRYEPIGSAMMMDLADVERVEVLKGPQGTLYGRNATGGAIRVISKAVSDDLEGQMTAGYGNYDYYSLSGSVNVPLAENFGARVTGLMRKRDAFARNLVAGARDADDLDSWAVRGKFRLKASDTVTANLTLGYWKQADAAGMDQIDLSPPGRSTGIARGGITGRKRSEIASLLDSMQRAEQFSAEFRIDADLGGVDLASITTYADYKGRTDIDADGTSARVFDAPGSRSTSRNFSQEFQLVSNSGKPVEWVAGLYYFSGRGWADNHLDLGAAALYSIGDQRNKTEVAAIFGQLTWQMAERWNLTVGGRLSYEEKTVRTRSSDKVAGPTLALTPFDDKADWLAFTPKLTLQYKLDNAMLYLTYARGFKSGGYNYPARSPAGLGGVLDPEILDMVEFGMKGDFFDRRLRANAALYFYDYKDLQVTRASNTSGGSVASVTENAANARIYGLDLDLVWSVTDNLTLTSGLNISKSKYRDFVTTAKVFNTLPATGTRDVAYDASGHGLLRSPKWSAFISAEYDLQLGDAGHMPITLSYSYKDDYLFDFIADPLTERLRQKAYGLLNARVTYIPSENWRISGWVNNLTDVHYFDDLVAAGSGLRGSYGAPRTYGVEASFSF